MISTSFRQSAWQTNIDGFIMRVVYCRDGIVGISNGKETPFFSRRDKVSEDFMRKGFEASNRIHKRVLEIPKTYFYVTELGEIRKKDYRGDFFDECAKCYGNFFKTRKKAEKSIDVIVELLRNLKEYGETHSCNFERL